MAVALANALELQSALAGESWPDEYKLLQQVDGIGRVYARKLFTAGIHDLNELAACEESRIEVVCARNPPFGHKVKAQLKELFTQTSLSAEMQDGIVLCEGKVSGKEQPVHFLVVAQLEKESKILHHELIQKEPMFSCSIKLPQNGLLGLSCSLIITAHAGCNRHVTFKIAQPKPQVIELKSFKPICAVTPKPEKSTAPKIVPISSSSDFSIITPPAKRTVPSPISSEKSIKTRQFLNNRNMTLTSAQTFLQKYAPVNTPPIRSSLLLPKASVQQSLIDEIEFELRYSKLKYCSVNYFLRSLEE